MDTNILEEDWGGKIEKFLLDAYYLGERAILRGKKGGKAVIIPPEDLDFLEKVENLLNGACYSGERVILKGKDGCKVAIVSLEDLELLEGLESIEV